MYSSENPTNDSIQVAYPVLNSKIYMRKYGNPGIWTEWIIFSDDATKLPVSKIIYNSDNKAEALHLLDNPTELFGEKDTAYCIIFQDTVGDSIFGGGKVAIFGYIYADNDYGSQLAMSFASALLFRSKSKGSWGDFKSVAFS